ncbi:DNA recombination protein RmuC [Carboxylicivirga sediminis]|uniref:DNA recombination protein RmuC n=1 Tax=Carboxylicivirga sediminis TaxID=2006564 RepID=A0A941F1P8_9BACT|nr:DNA recombination protein RmuC [Carboxylicivirga sediminis]MBR8535121.1 DNA recombination protein RmuC [Carboxylicivirga sediminis]
MEIIAIIISALCLVLLAILVFRKKENNVNPVIEAVQQLLQRELKDNRSELSVSLKENREELSNGLDKLTQKLEEKLTVISDGLNKNGKENREELTRSLKDFSDTFSKNVKDFNDLQKQKFDAMATKQDELVKTTELKLEKVRETVDEKLHKTLEERLGQSFKIVSERLEAVQKGLGEMQNLANGVGDLKKVLSNVKTRGVLGEIQLGNILEQIMAPEQYEANVKTKQGSNDHVEFAIKLPGKDDFGKEVFLPIDAKFPQEDYIRLQTAYDEGDIDGIDKANKALIQSIKKFAKDISDKYLDPPHTTDFGIMFLPIEGLYAEIVRQPDLVALLQREFKIIITGPTTLAAMLNSLQMGFKTLAIQKRSSEVWQILGAVKKQFGEFGTVLKKAQEKIRQADGEIEKLVTTRTNVMLSKLKTVEELPSAEATAVLGEAIELETED